MCCRASGRKEGGGKGFALDRARQDPPPPAMSTARNEGVASVTSTPRFRARFPVSPVSRSIRVHRTDFKTWRTL